MGLTLETRFASDIPLDFVSLVCIFWKVLRMLEYAIVFRSCSFWEMQKYGKISQKELEARRWESVCFPFS